MKEGTGCGTSLGGVKTSQIRRSRGGGRALPDEFGLLAQLLEYGAPGEAPGGAGLAPGGAGGAAGPALQGHTGGMFLQHPAAAAVKAPSSSWASAALLLTAGQITKPIRNSILSVLWIRMNPHPDPHQFADKKPHISLFEHFFKGLSHLFGR